MLVTIVSNLNTQYEILHSIFFNLLPFSNKWLQYIGSLAICHQHWTTSVCHCVVKLLCWKVLSLSHHGKNHKLIPRRYQGLTICSLPRSGVFYLRRHLMCFIVPHSMGCTQCCIHPCLNSSGQVIISYGKEVTAQCVQ